jgi:hypothetical protein
VLVVADRGGERKQADADARHESGHRVRAVTLKRELTLSVSMIDSIRWRTAPS